MAKKFELNRKVYKNIKKMDHNQMTLWAESVGVMSTVYRKPDQIIEPYQFAESEDDKENYVMKRTCLWLKGLKHLKTNDLPRPDNAQLYCRWSNGKARCWNELVYSKERAVIRSKTFTGITKAMAEQWGIF